MKRPAHPVCRPRGVTLMQFLVALAILSLLLHFGVRGFGGWLQSAQIRTTADTLRDGLQLARAEAVRRNAQVALTVAGSGWSVAQVNPAVAIQSRSAQESTPNAVVSGSQTTVTFNGLGQLTSGSGVTFSVTNPTGGACRAAGGAMTCLNVVVQAGGAVRLCDPALPSSNPQSCAS